MPSATTKRPSVVENITVLQIGEFGVRVGEKSWYNVNEPLTPQHFQLNQSYKVSLSVAKSGKKYINEIIGVHDSAQAGSAPTETAKAEQASSDDPVKAAEAALAKAKADAEAKVKAEAQAAAAKAAAPSGVASAKGPYRAGYDKPLSEYDLAKDKQISRSGVVQAAMQSAWAASYSTSIDEYLSNVKKIADFAFKYIQE